MSKRLLTYCLTICIGFSCGGKDEEQPCIAPTFEKNIIGTWTSSLESSPKETDDVTFSDDGTFKETSGMLFGKANSPAITWKATKDTLEISGKFSNNTATAYVFSKLVNTCDSIVLNVEGFDKIFMKRK